jgi:hypothetical protein
MTSEQAKRLEDFRAELHISHSQIFQSDLHLPQLLTEVLFFLRRGENA